MDEGRQEILKAQIKPGRKKIGKIQNYCVEQWEGKHLQGHLFKKSHCPFVPVLEPIIEFDHSHAFQLEHTENMSLHISGLINTCDQDCSKLLWY